MRILWLNWRDHKHPRAGGAELVTLRVAQRLVELGHRVEWFSAAYPGAPSAETESGITFVRAGSQATVHAHAFARYRRSRFDVVIDEVNTIPFFAHLYMRAPCVALVHQLAAEIWQYELGPAGLLGRLLEPLYLRPYRSQPIVTVSESSRESLRAIGMRGTISIIDEAVDDPADAVVGDKSAALDVVYLGRLSPSKRVEHCVRAAAVLASAGWKGRLLIAGSGDERYVARLRDEANRIAPGRVGFLGRVSDEARARLLRSAACVWMTSVREGWGLVATEAARHGTPTVAYRVPGLVDSVRDGVTGVIVNQEPAALAAGTRRVFDDLFGFSQRALREFRGLNWDATTRQLLASLQRVAGQNARGYGEVRLPTPAPEPAVPEPAAMTVAQIER